MKNSSKNGRIKPGDLVYPIATNRHPSEMIVWGDSLGPSPNARGIVKYGDPVIVLKTSRPGSRKDRERHMPDVLIITSDAVVGWIWGDELVLDALLDE